MLDFVRPLMYAQHPLPDQHSDVRSCALRRHLRRHLRLPPALPRQYPLRVARPHSPLRWPILAGEAGTANTLMAQTRSCTQHEEETLTRAIDGVGTVWFFVRHESESQQLRMNFWMENPSHSGKETPSVRVHIC